LFAAREIFPKFFGSPVAAQFRLALDLGFARCLRFFSVFVHAAGLPEFAWIQKRHRLILCEDGNCGLRLP
jgi:hypothetical protein